MVFFELREIFRSIIVAAGLCLAGMTLGAAPASATPVAVDQTIAFELYRMEAAARPLPAEIEVRLRSVLTDARAALGPNARPPSNSTEFLAFAERVGISFAEHNFVQPNGRADWRDSIGEALTPVSASHPRLAEYLAGGGNDPRRPHQDPSRPYFFVDCDMAAQLLISVAQMVGFELHLVHVPDHEFVRWDDGRGGHSNWDWTNWGSLSDDDYRRMYLVTPAQVNRGVYLTGQSLSQALGYYLTGISRNVRDRPRRLELLRRAAPLSANHPHTASNFAWLFATETPGIRPEERREALVYGLTGWAGDPNSPAQMNAVACALAAREEWPLAVAIQIRAIQDAASDDLGRYQNELARLRARQSC